MARLKNVDLELAALGARVRIAELEQQLAELRRRFPSASGSKASTATPAVRRRKRTFTAAERKAISARMKRRWADWRKKKGT
jgi:cytochrome c556